MEFINVKVRQIQNMRPIDNTKSVFTQKEIDHFYECRKPNCPKCVEIAKR